MSGAGDFGGEDRSPSAVRNPVPALSQDVSKVFAERYAYFPSVGFGLITTVTLARLAQRSERWYRAALATGLGVAVLFAGLTVARYTVWRDSFTLWTGCVQKSPNLRLAHENLALALIRRGQAEEGKRELQVALPLDPTLPEQSVASGVLAARRGQFLQAILTFQTALAYRPDLVDAHYNLGVAYESRDWVDAAAHEYQAVLAPQPDHADAHNNLGVLLARANRLDDAISHFEASLRSRPDDPQVGLNLAHAYELRGLPALAEEQHRLAARAGTSLPRSR